MTIETRPLQVRDGQVAMEPLLVAPADAGAEPRPAVLIFPTIMGLSQLELGFAERLAALGYTAVVADLYGWVGKPREECRAMMMELLGDRPRLEARLLATLEAVRDQSEVNPNRMAAIGYCFGGLCALDLARSGADLRGVASFHGLFTPPGHGEGRPVRAKIVAFHGWDDPMAPPASVEALGAELTAAGADWQVHAYGGVMHGFTNPAANDPERGVLYDARADARSWAALQLFLAECLA